MERASSGRRCGGVGRFHTKSRPLFSLQCYGAFNPFPASLNPFPSPPPPPPTGSAERNPTPVRNRLSRILKCKVGDRYRVPGNEFDEDSDSDGEHRERFYGGFCSSNTNP